MLSIRKAAVAAAAVGAFVVPVTTATTASAAATEYKCSPFKCSQLTNAGTRPIVVIFGTATSGDVMKCTNASQKDGWCLKRSIAGGQTSYQNWDADAFAIPPSCTAQFYYHGSKDKPTGWYDVRGGSAWPTVLKIGRQKDGWDYFKFSSDLKVRVTSCS